MHDSARVEQFTEELKSWNISASAQQRELHDQYRELLNEDRCSLSRERGQGHFTASALIVDPQRARVLLVMHPRVKRWLQMGGHIEPVDLSFRAAAMRESIEESGYTNLEVLQVPTRLDRHDVPCKSASGEVIQSIHWDVQFLALVDSQEQREITENAATQWWDLDSSMPDLDHSVELLIGSAQRFLGE